MTTIIVQLAVILFIALVGLYAVGALCLVIALEDIPLILKIIYAPIFILGIAVIVILDIDIIRLIF